MRNNLRLKPRPTASQTDAGWLFLNHAVTLSSTLKNA